MRKDRLVGPELYLHRLLFKYPNQTNLRILFHGCLLYLNALWQIGFQYLYPCHEREPQFFGK